MITILNFFFGFILGSVLGSLTKALADRSLQKKSFFGRSECVYCKKKLRVFDLFPILSYLLLKGECRYCHKKLSREYLLTEVVVAVLVALVFIQSPITEKLFANPLQAVLTLYDLAFKIFLIVVFSAVFLTDLKESLIPDRITAPSIIVALMSISAVTIYKIFLTYWTLSQSELGRLLLPPHTNYLQRHVLIITQDLFGSVIIAIVIGLFFLSLILITKGRGMGGGDLKLGIFIGLAFGFPQAILVLMLSFLLGSVVGIILLLIRKKSFGQTIPFGPFLSLAALISIYGGNQLLNWYLKFKV